MVGGGASVSGSDPLRAVRARMTTTMITITMIAPTMYPQGGRRLRGRGVCSVARDIGKLAFGESEEAGWPSTYQESKHPFKDQLRLGGAKALIEGGVFTWDLAQNAPGVTSGAEAADSM